MNETKTINVVVIGAGFGGLACVKKLAKDNKVNVILVDRRNHHLFQPLLYQVATASLAAPHIARSVRSLFKDQENVSVMYDLAVDFDLNNKTVKMENGADLTYDYMVIATGAQTSFFGNDQWAEHVHQLKTLSGAFNIRKQVLRNIEIAETAPPEEQELLSTIVIVGGGPTGVELSGAFADLVKRQMKTSFSNFKPENLRIVLVEGMKNILGVFDEDQSQYAKKHLESIGVEVRTEAMVSNIEKNKVTLKDGEVIEAGTIIWTAGVQATPLTQKIDAERTRGGLVHVTNNLNLEKYPEVFIIGDTAAVDNGEGKFVPGVAPAAVQGGEYVASHILDTENGTKVPEPFKYTDKGKMAIIGQHSAIVDVNGLKFQGFVGWVIWLLIHVLFLVDFRSMVGVMGAWFWAYVRNLPGARIFTSSAEEDLA